MTSNMIKKVIYTALGLCVLVGAIGTGKYFQMQYNKAQQAKMTLPPPMVKTVLTQTQTWHPEFTSVGTLSAIQGTAIQNQVSGRITEINFTSGQNVKKDTVLLKLDNAPILAQIDKAKTQVKLASIQEQRQEKLIKTNATTASTLDEAIETLKASQAELKQLEAELAYTQITAPFDGQLGLQTLSVGQYLPIGSTITHIETTNPIRVNYPIPDAQIPAVKTGLSVEISAASYPNQTFTGKITGLHSQIAANTKSLEAQALIQNNDPSHLLLPGAFVTVTTLLANQENVITIPETAIVSEIYGNFVYEINHSSTGDTLHEVSVQLGDIRNGQAQVLSGLKANTLIVDSPQFNLQDGQPVRTQ